MKPILAVIVIAGLGALGWLGWNRFFATGDAEPAPAADVHVVARGPIDVSITESAVLRAERSVNLRCELETRTAVTKVVPEGATVKEGDELLVLDASEIKDREDNQQINVSQSEANVTAAEKEVAIQESRNASELAKAGDAVLFARIDLAKFLGESLDGDPAAGAAGAAGAEIHSAGVDGAAGAEVQRERLGEKQQQITKAQADLNLAEDEVDRTRKRLKWTKELHERKYVSDDDLETDELALQRFENQFRHAANALYILENYTLVRQEKDLRAKLALAEAEMERVNLRAEAELVQRGATLSARRQQHEMETVKLEKLRKQLQSAVIRAPIPGIVVYAQLWDQYGPAVLKEGLEVRQGQTLIILPDLGSMIAQCRVHEAQVERVRVGQRVTVKVEAFPDAVFTGKVERVGVLPDGEDGWGGSQGKVYATTISLRGEIAELRPGQSASAEIHVAHKDDVLSAPVQTVHRIGRVTYAWRITAAGPEAAPVRCGLMNDQFVEITDGLAEGDRVALAWPAGAKEPEFPELERRLEQEEKDAAARAAANPDPAGEPASGTAPSAPETSSAAPRPAPEPEKPAPADPKPAAVRGAKSAPASPPGPAPTPTKSGLIDHPDGEK